MVFYRVASPVLHAVYYDDVGALLAVQACRHLLCALLVQQYDARASYGVESSRDIDTHDLIDICGKLSAQLNKKQDNDTDKLRKRVMAAIGSWLRSTGRTSNASIIKGIACRCTGYNDFNKIPRERLRNLIGLFNNKQTDARQTEAVKQAILSETLARYVGGDNVAQA